MSGIDNEAFNDTEPENESSVRNVLSPGSMLREKREAGDLDLTAIARELNLDPWMLTALEADEFSKFGAQVFAKGHLKHYAQHLGLNPEDVLFAYYQVAERKETTPVITKHLSTASQKKSYSRLSKWFVRILGLLALAALAYGAYQGVMWWLSDARENSSSVKEISLSPLQETSPSQSVPIANSQNLNVVDNQDTVTTELAPQNTQVAVVSSDRPTDETLSLDAPLVDPETGEIARSVQGDTSSTGSESVSINSSVNEQPSLYFEFNESSWVEVFTESGDRLIYGMANKGTVKDLKITGPTEIFLGNALGTVIKLNGEIYNIPDNAKAGRTARFVLEPNL